MAYLNGHAVLTLRILSKVAKELDERWNHIRVDLFDSLPLDSWNSRNASKVGNGGVR